jgi:hypothetical protein
MKTNRTDTKRVAQFAIRYSIVPVLIATVALIHGVCSLTGATPGSWAQKADIPQRASTPASCVVDGILYIVGGHYPHQTALKTVWAYDQLADSWTRKADLPAPRHLHAAAAVDGIIYVVGGTGVGWPGALMYPVEAYDPKTDTWATKANLPTGRAALAVCALDGIIYLFGGMTENLYGSYDLVLAYNPARDSFTARRRMPWTWLTAGCGAIDGKIYLVAGLSKECVVNSDAVYYQALAVFDPQAGVMPRILSLAFEGPDQLKLVWQAEAGLQYKVESSPEVASRRWTRVLLPTGGTVSATNALVETTCPLAPETPRRFYRVVETN